ncbi:MULTISPECIES: sensor histidine kinase [unclassified Streptomyces]|uniref:sensor histidine kinase n=1 Tax=unclassified Streptomyces TaxID=2593676 RepID=UPI00278C6584|nr:MULTISPECIES: sensor histidine kinase [unclassified Streptomyces]
MRVRWRDRSKVERVEWQTRVTLRAVNWMFFLAWSVSGLAGSLLHSTVPYVLGGSLLAVNLVQCLVGNRHALSALDQYLGRGRVPRSLTVASGALALVALGVLALLTVTDSVRDGLIAMPLVFAPMPFGCAYALTVPLRAFVRQAAVAIVVAVAVAAAVGTSPGGLVVVALLLTLSTVLALLTFRCSAWSLSVMWDSEHSREVEARLAVAEERLRFGRDLHDVMGRNLSVVALKSELAVQLARRGRTEDAVAQMTEVQRIAQESQREVREVVRGYREADLGAELAGAKGVLGAAGIECTVTGSAAGLPDEAQSALGWVVREASTNVLRHGDAKACRVELVTGAEEVVLTVENDGAGAGTGGGQGSGLTGLRERLAAVAGTLEAGEVRAGVFRVVAKVPVAPADVRESAEVVR